MKPEHKREVQLAVGLIVLMLLGYGACLNVSLCAVVAYAEPTPRATPTVDAGQPFCVSRAQFVELQASWEAEPGYKLEIKELRRALAEQERATAAAVATTLEAEKLVKTYQNAFDACHADLMRRLTVTTPSVLDSPFLPGAVGCLLCGGMCVGLTYAQKGALTP